MGTENWRCLFFHTESYTTFLLAKWVFGSLSSQASSLTRTMNREAWNRLGIILLWSSVFHWVGVEISSGLFLMFAAIQWQQWKWPCALQLLIALYDSPICGIVQGLLGVPMKNWRYLSISTFTGCKHYLQRTVEEWCCQKAPYGVCLLMRWHWHGLENRLDQGK